MFLFPFLSLIAGFFSNRKIFLTRLSTSASNSGRLFREMIKYRTFLIPSLFVKNIIFNYLKKKFKLFDSVHGFKENNIEIMTNATGQNFFPD